MESPRTAFAKDANGREHTLSFLRTPGGTVSSGNGRWFAVLDYSQFAIGNNSSTGQTVLAVKEYAFPPKNGWNYYDPNYNPPIDMRPGTIIRMVRSGNVFTAKCSQFGSTILDPNSTITIDLDQLSDTYPVLSLFKGSASWGYSCMSQTNSQYENISVTRNVSATGKDYTISQKLESGEIRIVLEWDATPNDLDSHLIGKTDSGVDVNVNFNNKKSNYNGKELASLDLDDVDGFGPETTTIKDIDGVYDFYVFDYTKSSTMANGNARVTVYLPDNTVQVVNINKSAGIANEWNVLHIDHGKVSTVNTSSSVLNDSADTW